MSDATYLRLRAAALCALIVGAVGLAAGEDPVAPPPPAQPAAPAPIPAAPRTSEWSGTDRPLVLRPDAPSAPAARCPVPGPRASHPGDLHARQVR